MHAKTLSIPARFNGPPTTGNGGYVCGLLANEFDGPSEAALRIPPPLDTPLQLGRDNDRVFLHHGDALIGEAKPASLSITAPQAPSLAEARDAATRYRGFNHAFQTCFVCGSLRAPGDGMHVFAGPMQNRDLFACTWSPGADLADAQGQVAPEFIFAALDCPGYWTIPGAGPVIAVLGRYTMALDAPRPRVGEELIV
ncbi:MAG TPA: hypothetical protein VM915_15495, partial [Verrucomicrobiae bacterium]|nr:hypothetical protein [Verrucomicrobiae bacterium]